QFARDRQDITIPERENRCDDGARKADYVYELRGAIAHRHAQLGGDEATVSPGAFDGLAKESAGDEGVNHRTPPDKTPALRPPEGKTEGRKEGPRPTHERSGAKSGRIYLPRFAAAVI